MPEKASHHLPTQQPPTHQATGWHVLVDFYGCSPVLLASPDALMPILRASTHAAGAHILAEHCHHFGEQQGVTAVLLLKESHMSIHTWPETGFVALDIFMCGSTQTDAALAVLMAYFAPQRQVIHKIKRGTVI